MIVGEGHVVMGETLYSPGTALFDLLDLELGKAVEP